jgi:hypothetical protein
MRILPQIYVRRKHPGLRRSTGVKTGKRDISRKDEIFLKEAATDCLGSVKDYGRGGCTDFKR